MKGGAKTKPGWLPRLVIHSFVLQCIIIVILFRLYTTLTRQDAYFKVNMSLYNMRVINEWGVNLDTIQGQLFLGMDQ